MNDPKYFTGPIVNTASGETIPADEPVIIFRARDIHARTIIAFYAELLDGPSDDPHRDAVNIRFEKFCKFAKDHPERMKNPDTDLANQGKFPVNG